MQAATAGNYFQVLSYGILQEVAPSTMARWMEQNLFSNLPYAAPHPLSLLGQQSMKVWQERYRSDPQAQERLEADFLYLFVGAGRPLAPPWGAWYRNEKQLLFQEEADEVQRWMQRYGCQVEEAYGIADDYLAYELDFVAHILKNRKVSSPEAWKDLLYFLQEQMLTWVPLWNQDVQKNAETDYYRAIANLIQAACETLAEEVEEICAGLW